jgi:L-glyceraldehyde 3-phosphate reductase
MPLFAQNRYTNMPYRRSGKWGLKLPAISLGAWETFGGYRGAETARECLYQAFDLGITHFDLANNYGKPAGNAEIVVGQIVRDMPRDELIISTKAGYPMWPGPYGDGLSKKYLQASLDQSLKRLGLDYVDIFYAHRPDSETPLEETLTALDLMVRQGKALYVGLSNFPGALFQQAVALTKELGLAPITIHQPRYNLLARGPESDLFEHALTAGTGVITFSPLAQGLLSEKYLNIDLPVDSRAALLWDKQYQKRMVNTETLARVQQLHTLAQERGQTLAQMALAWNLLHPAVTSVLIGASKVEQIVENVAALHNLSFSDAELRMIDEITIGSSH